jgi:hypothetical protein
MAIHVILDPECCQAGLFLAGNGLKGKLGGSYRINGQQGGCAPSKLHLGDRALAIASVAIRC